MPSIIDMGLASLRGIAEQVERDTLALEGVSKPLRKVFLDKGLIHKVPVASEDDNRATVTVDGAVVVQQLASGDLIQTGAVAAEGLHGNKRFTDDGPAEFYQCVIEHDNKNTSHAGALMALQEIVMMGANPDLSHDVRIIDGAWAPGVISVMMTLFKSVEGSTLLNTYILDMLEQEKWEGWELPSAIDRRVAPWHYTDESKHGRLVAIGKSDSANRYEKMARKTLSEIGLSFPSSQAINDRTLAGIVLEPGEMFMPRSLDMARSMRWEPGDLGVNPDKWDWTKLACIKSLWENFASHPHAETAEEILKASLISGYERSDGSHLPIGDALTKSSQDQWVWSTYFKSSTAGPFQRPLRIDFSRPAYDNLPQGEKIDPGVIVGYIGDTLSVINADTVNEVQEPMSQYLADQRAKDISHVAKFTREHLVSTLTTERGIAGVSRNYRT